MAPIKFNLHSEYRVVFTENAKQALQDVSSSITAHFRISLVQAKAHLLVCGQPQPLSLQQDIRSIETDGPSGLPLEETESPDGLM